MVMEAVATGSAEAFEEILRRYQDRVLGLLVGMLGDRETARDLTQECFLRLLRHAGRYRPKARFSSYLFTIARRLAYDETGRAWRRRESLPDTLPDPGEDPAERTERLDQESRLREAIGALPDAEREVFLMSERGGLRYKEIARAVGCPEGTVASRKNRALRMLRKALREVRS